MVLLFLRDWRSASHRSNTHSVIRARCDRRSLANGPNVNIMDARRLALRDRDLVDEYTVRLKTIHAHLARGQSMVATAQWPPIRGRDRAADY